MKILLMKTVILATLCFVLMATAPTAIAAQSAETSTAQVGKVYPEKYWDAFDKEFSEGLAAVEKDAKAGFVDKYWRLVIPPVYDFVFPFNGGQALAKRDGKWFFINRSGKRVAALPCDEVMDANKDYSIIGVQTNGKYSLISKTGKLIKTFPYESASKEFQAGLWAMKSGGKWGFVSIADGTPVTPFRYDGFQYFSCGLCPVSEGDKWGFINTKGTLVIPLQYDKVYLFDPKKRCNLVEKNGERYYIDTTGRRIPNPYVAENKGSSDWTDADLEQLAETVQGVYLPGKTYPRSKWDKVESFSDGLAQVCVNDTWGYIDSSDRLVIAPDYRYSRPFSQGVAAVYQGGWKFIDKSGRVVGTTPYYVLRVEKDVAKVSDRARLSDDGKCGLVKNDGTVLALPVYDDVEFPHEGLFQARKGGKWGFVDLTGKVVIPFRYEASQYFKDGYAAVKENGKWGFVDRQGRIAVPLEYENAYFVEPGGRTAQVKKDGRWILVRLPAIY